MSKKEDILTTALELFAREGFSSVSTKKIAAKARVSEGLIFRHYTNKQGLLSAIMEQAKQKTIDLFAPIILQADPAKAIKMAIELPYNIPPEQYPFWKLTFKLKWEASTNIDDKMAPLLNKLSWAFSQLKYPNAKKEAEVLLHIIEGISTAVLRDNRQDQKPLKQFLFQKYKL
ncbi:MAG: TetR/AcrR family transcriptional regulator [Flavobacteriaceae bacterium]